MPTPEQQARDEIDRMLDAAGWAVQNAAGANLSAGRGIASIGNGRRLPGRGRRLFITRHAINVSGGSIMH
jgi:type I restriction enzyme R subunit